MVRRQPAYLPHWRASIPPATKRRTSKSSSWQAFPSATFEANPPPKSSSAATRSFCQSFSARQSIHDSARPPAHTPPRQCRQNTAPRPFRSAVRAADRRGLTTGKGQLPSPCQRRGLSGALPARLPSAVRPLAFLLPCPFSHPAPDHRASGQRRGTAGRCRGERAKTAVGEFVGSPLSKPVQNRPASSRTDLCKSPSVTVRNAPVAHLRNLSPSH